MTGREASVIDYPTFWCPYCQVEFTGRHVCEPRR